MCPHEEDNFGRRTRKSGRKGNDVQRGKCEKPPKQVSSWSFVLSIILSFTPYQEAAPHFSSTSSRISFDTPGYLIRKWQYQGIGQMSLKSEAQNWDEVVVCPGTWLSKYFLAMLGNTLLCLDLNYALPGLDRSEDVMKRKGEGRYHEASDHRVDFKLNRSLMPLQERGTTQHPRHSKSRMLQDQDRRQQSA